MEFLLESPLSHSSLHNNFTNTDQTLPISLFLVEFQHMPSSHYFNTLKSSPFLLTNRNNAVSLIIQCSRKFDDLSLTYLAVNYLDRFLSSEDNNMLESKPWILKLISLSCVSLSAKMRKPEISLHDLPEMVESEIFDVQMIERMENVILGALKWRMRSVTPFSFFEYFLNLFDLQENSLLKHSLKSKAIDLTYNLQHDIKFLEFKPSVIAGATLLIAISELSPLQFSHFSNTISQCIYVNKEEVMECYKAIEERVTVEEDEGSTETAVNVLDQQFSSCESDKSFTTMASSPSKRRKTSY